MIHDVAILGGGPAGLSVASALATLGLKVALISPDVYGDWKNNYGVWVDELDGLSITDPFSTIWDQPVAHFDGRTKNLGRTYARLSNGSLQTQFFESLTSATVLDAKASDVTYHGDVGSIATSVDEVTARLVIDARGAVGTPTTAAQTAYGIAARVTGDPLGAPMVLMDWRGNTAADIPSFLYGMRLADDVVFLEETVLAARPAVGIETLKDRLYARLARMEVDVVEVLEVERCYIPMDVPMSGPSRTVKFGAAAGFVHPATGYSVARSLNTAPALAESITAHWGLGTEALAQAAWETVWPERARHTRKLYELGLEVVLKLDGDQIPTFFEQFFECPDELWQAYLWDTGTVGDVAQLMWRVFRNGNTDLKWQLARYSSMAALLPRARV
ncbi:MAG: lycopene cyclase family protein [bacterium]